MAPPLLMLLLATTWHVQSGADGGADAGGGTAAKPFGTVKEGLDSARPGDTVVVGPGTYFENLRVTKNQIMLVAQDAGTAIIDGSRAAVADSPALHILGGDWVVRGLVFANGRKYNLQVDPCASDGGIGIELDGISTKGLVRPASNLCSSGSGDAAKSYDVRVNCSLGQLWVHDSRLLAEACSSNLYVSGDASVVIEDNEVSGAHGRPVWIDDGPSEGGVIRRNHIHGPCCDGNIGGKTEVTHGLSIDGNKAKNFTVDHNLIEHTGDYGIVILDNNDTQAGEGHLVHNNTLVGMRECGILLDSVSAVTHSNLVSGIICKPGQCQNACAAPCAVSIIHTQAMSSAPTVELGYDLFDGTTDAYCVVSPTATVVHRGPVTNADVGFLDGGKGDYQLGPLSPAIEAGDPSVDGGLDFAGQPVPSDSDFDGVRRAEIGAFEFFGPHASAEPAEQEVDAGQQASIDGRGSKAQAGASVVSFQWEKAEGPTGFALKANSSTQQFFFSQSGTYAVNLVVVDSRGRVSPPVRAVVHVRGDEYHPPVHLPGCSCNQAPVSLAALMVLALAKVHRRRRR